MYTSSNINLALADQMGGGTPFEFYKIENIVIKHSKNSNNKKTEGEE